MLIIRRAVPAIAQSKAVRSVLNRIDVDRMADRYDIYIEGTKGISLDYLVIHDQRYVNIRVYTGVKTGIISFQVNLNDCEEIKII